MRRATRPEFQALMSLVLLLIMVFPTYAEDAQSSLDKMRNFNAIQTIYRRGVPHTDRQGRPIINYSPDRSFFQIGIWGNPIGEIYGVNYNLAILKEAGFNTMWPWPVRSLADLLQAGKEAALQVVAMGELNVADAAKLKDHPHWLGNVWHDEPTGSFWGKDMEKKFKEFQDYKVKMNAAAPGVAVFINDVPWITAPATSWWVKWNTAGDVSCHDNYPVMNRKYRARSIGDEEHKTGIPASVALATAVNNEQKPVWCIVGAFEVRGHGGFPFRMPTPMQLRAQVYAALIHGATGIIYFCWDTYVCRDGEVMGMSPDPKVAYLDPGPNKPKASPAKPMEIAESKALWMAATYVNREIHELTPSLLSPTVDDKVPYTVQVTGSAISDTPVRCLLKPMGRDAYLLLTVNLDDAVLNATYELAGGVTSVEPLFENRTPYELKPGGKQFTDLYEPFDVHVYRIRTTPPPR